MKTKNFNLLMVFAFAFFLMSASNKTYAQCQPWQPQQQQQQQVNPNDGPKCGFGFIKGLTVEQEKQIIALKQNLIKEILPLNNQISEKKAHLKTVSSGDNVDIVAVNKTIDEMYLLKAEVSKKHNTFKQDVRKLLTAEQKIMFDLHQGKGMKCGKGKGCSQNTGMDCKNKEDGSGCGHGGGKGCGMESGKGCGMGHGDGKTGCNKGSDKDCCKNKEGAESGSQNPGCSHQNKGCHGK